MAFDLRKLKGKIVEVYDTQYNFAAAMGWAEKTVSQKINGDSLWRQNEIERAVELLGIPTESIGEYFFTPKVQQI